LVVIWANVPVKPVPVKKSKQRREGVIPCWNTMCSRPASPTVPLIWYLCSSDVPATGSFTCTIVTESALKLNAGTVQFPVMQSPASSVGEENENELASVLDSLPIVTITDLGLTYTCDAGGTWHCNLVDESHDVVRHAVPPIDTTAFEVLEPKLVPVTVSVFRPM
jgi:hypothetical protein